jgi:hypothetical protein
MDFPTFRLDGRVALVTAPGRESGARLRLASLARELRSSPRTTTTRRFVASLRSWLDWGSRGYLYH